MTKQYFYVDSSGETRTMIEEQKRKLDKIDKEITSMIKLRNEILKRADKILEELEELAIEYNIKLDMEEKPGNHKMNEPTKNLE